MRYTFDIETFKNFWCCTFVSVETKKHTQFVIWNDHSDRGELLRFMRQPDLFLISYNGISYDMPIIRFIRDYRGLPEDLNKEIYKLSTRLISDKSMNDDDIRTLRYPWPDDYVHQDLMAMMAFNKLGVGLKQCSINLKWHRIQDLPIEHTALIQEEDIDTVLDYNLNDALITLELYNNDEVKQERELRESLVPEYGNRMLSASRSKMANIFLETMYAEETAIDRKEFKLQRTERDVIDFSNVIHRNIKFTSKELNALKEELLKVSVFVTNEFKFSKKFYYKNNLFNLGIGGLHTDEKSAVYRKTDTQEIISMDVSSFYPAIMCEYGIMPAHLDKKFLTILDRIRKERIVAKKSGDKVKAESFKIVINSVFGKLGFNNYWLYDPLAMLRVTVNGQLFLLMLIERMEQAGIHCISANTDGIEIIVPKEFEMKAVEIARQWEKDTKFELEFTKYKLYAKRDVNNYIAITENGKVKTKGAFLQDISLVKGYKHPIIPRAVNEYFINGTPVEDTIKSSRNIMDFCITQKVGHQFDMEYRTRNGIEELQHTNRFYVSNKGGSLQKRKESTKKLTGLFVGHSVTILNDYNSSDKFEDYDVNFNFYIKECNDIIEELEPSVTQIDMFSNVEDWGRKTKLNV